VAPTEEERRLRQLQQIEATQGLSAEVRAAREAIEHSPVVKELKELTHNLKNAIIALAIFGLVLLAGLIFMFVLNDRLGDQQDQLEMQQDAIEHSQIVSCQNANDTRAGQRAAWDFVIDVSAADGPPGEVAALEKMRTWFHDVFANRDCADLETRYEVPVPPDVQELLDSVKGG
jgi:hypothetical protein